MATSHRRLAILLPEGPAAAVAVANAHGVDGGLVAGDVAEGDGSVADGPIPDLPEGEGGDECDRYLLVGELAKATGKTVRAIHHYEELGLLKPFDRSKGRYRRFTSDSVVRVRWISKLQNLGLSLGEIQILAQAQERSGSAMFAAAELRRVYESKLEETRDKIRELRTLERELEESLDYLSNCDTSCMPELPTASCTQCARHKEPALPPDLVAGVHAH